MPGNRLLDVALAVGVDSVGGDDDKGAMGADNGVICFVLHVLYFHVLILLLKV